MNLPQMVRIRQEFKTNPIRSIPETVQAELAKINIQDTIRARRVIVQERIDGSRYILYQGKRLRYQEITARPIKQPKATQTIQRIRRQWTPPSNHPWKRSYKPYRKRSAQRTTQAL